MKEFEFHMSPACSSSRPHTGVGTDEASSSSRRARRVVGEPARAVDCLADVGNPALTPEAQLVAEDPQTAGPTAADRALCDDAALARIGADSITHVPSGTPPRAPSGRDRRRLGAQAGWRRARRGGRSAERMPTGAERQPVQIDGGRPVASGCGTRRHRACANRDQPPRRCVGRADA